jgi:hypothetical protein
MNSLMFLGLIYTTLKAEDFCQQPRDINGHNKKKVAMKACSLWPKEPERGTLGNQNILDYILFTAINFKRKIGPSPHHHYQRV